jgi:hypothetical protein
LFCGQTLSTGEKDIQAATAVETFPFFVSFVSVKEIELHFYVTAKACVHKIFLFYEHVSHFRK